MQAGTRSLISREGRREPTRHRNTHSYYCRVGKVVWTCEGRGKDGWRDKTSKQEQHVCCSYCGGWASHPPPPPSLAWSLQGGRFGNGDRRRGGGGVAKWDCSAAFVLCFSGVGAGDEFGRDGDGERGGGCLGVSCLRSTRWERLHMDKLASPRSALNGFGDVWFSDLPPRTGRTRLALFTAVRMDK